MRRARAAFISGAATLLVVGRAAPGAAFCRLPVGGQRGVRHGVHATASDSEQRVGYAPASRSVVQRRASSWSGGDNDRAVITAV